MLVRSTLGRWAAAPAAARDLSQLARALHQTLAARNASALPAARALTRAYRAALGARRSYATTTAATQPTATVKKAVKARAAAKPAAKKAAASKTTRAKTATKTAKKPAKKATAAKAKPKAKKKKAAAKKPAPKKRVKKVLSPEEKEKAKIRELRQLALKEPVTRGALSARNAYIAERLKGLKSGNETAALTAAAKGFADLTPAEREHYNHLANQATAAKQAEYDAWIRSHTPEQIHTANLARAQLRRRLKGAKVRGTPRHTARLVDDRRSKRPSATYATFLKERFSTGDMKGISVTEATRIIAKEWKALSASEKKKYDDEYQAEMAKWKSENGIAT